LIQPREAERQDTALKLLSPEVREMTHKSLEYLLRMQNSDGSWSDSQYPLSTGVTALCCLALIAEGNQARVGPHGKALDKGIEYLQKALALRPKYFEAMVYVNLLYRQRSFSLFDDPAEWQKSVDNAKTWMCKSIETQGKPLPPTCTVKGGGGAAQEGDQVGKEGADSDAAPAVPEKGAKGKGKGAKGGKKKPGKKGKKKH